MYLVNKYSRWYYDIIQKSPNVKVIGHTERHHIIPKSMGGKDTKDNLVYVSLREHFILHKLLTRMTTGSDLSRMWMAVWHMSNTRTFNLSSREYENIKLNYTKQQSTISKEMWERPEYSSLMKMCRSTEEYSRKQSLGKIANWKNQEFRDAQMNTRNSLEFREKLSSVRKKSCDTDEFREWARSLHTKSWKVTHKIHTSGNWIQISNITKFCIDNNLSQGNMGEVARGVRKQHKGWVCRKIDDFGNDIICEFVPKQRQPHTEETKKKIGDLHRGSVRKPHSPETVEKLKKAATAREIKKRLIHKPL